MVTTTWRVISLLLCFICIVGFAITFESFVDAQDRKKDQWRRKYDTRFRHSENQGRSIFRTPYASAYSDSGSRSETRSKPVTRQSNMRDSQRKQTHSYDPDSLRVLDDTIVTTMLRIVDHKFDTISDRITALERAINGLQYYSIRQFRLLHTSTASVNRQMQVVTTRVSGLEIELSRGDLRQMRMTLNQVKYDINTMIRNSNGMFEAIESNLLRVNQNIETRVTELKGAMGKGKAKHIETVRPTFESPHTSTRNATYEMFPNYNDFSDTLVNDTFNDTTSDTKNETDISNYDSNRTNAFSNDIPNYNESNKATIFSNDSTYNDEPLQNESVLESWPTAITNTDIRDIIAVLEKNIELKLDDIFQLNRPVSSGCVNVSEITKYVDRSIDDKFNEWTMGINNQGNISEFVEHLNEFETRMTTTVGDLLQETSDRIFGINNLTNSRCLDRLDAIRRDSLEIDLLPIMLAKVDDSVKYLRYTGDLIEEIATNTENLIRDHENINKLINSRDKKGHENVQSANQRNYIEPPDEIGEESQTHYYRCEFPTERMINQFYEVAKNGTHLVELLTELGHISTVALTTTLLELNSVIEKLDSDRYKTKLEPLVTTHSESIDKEPRQNQHITCPDLEEIRNSTRSTLSLIEAVSANTGWIPYILEGVEVTLRTSNQTFHSVRELQLQIREHVLKVMVETHTKLLSVTKHSQNNSSGNMTDQAECGCKELDVIKKFDKVLPSMMHLMAKTGLLIALQNGSSQNQGRVELFQDGVWGTLCNKAIKPIDATHICSLLGFPGGLIAHDNRFGPGTGPVWHIRSDCLQKFVRNRITHAHRCLSNALETNTCDHGYDLGVICEHFIRISNNRTIFEKRPFEGYVEVYHQGTWGVVCSRGWNHISADVACRQLGFLGGEAIESGLITAQSGPVWLSDVTCELRDERLDECNHPGWKLHECPDNSLARVTCIK